MQTVFQMKRKGISTIVGMILILAVISTAIVAITTHYLPVLEERLEFKHEKSLIYSFLKLEEIYPGNGTTTLNLGISNVFSPVQTSATVKLWKSGDVTIDVAGRKFDGKLFAIKLYVFNTRIPDESVTFSEGGIKFYQGGKNLTLNPPNIRVYRTNKNVYISVDNLVTKQQEISGNGLAFINIEVLNRIYNFKNVSVTINVNDSIFESYWIYSLKKAGFVLTGNTANLNNVNLTLEIKNYYINLY